MTTIASILSPIGPVPDGWAVKPLRAVVRPLGRKNVGFVETNLLSLSYGSIVRKDIDALEGLLPESFEGYQIVEADDVVFRFTDLQNDQRSLRSGLVQERGIITSAYLAVRPTSINARYFAYLMRAYDQEKVFYSFGGGVRQSLKFDDVKRLPVPVPAVERQRRIAAFLDRETAQIDELIAKQEQLISTLAERRDRYLLSEVAPLAGDATGTEWFGMVPNDWRSTRLKYVSSVASGGTPSTQVEAYWSETEEGTPWVAISDMSGTEAVGSTAKRLTIDGLSQYAGAPGGPGTILFAMYASVGAVSRLAISATWNQAILGLTPRKDVDGDFLFYVLKAIRPHLVHYFRSNTQDNMNAQQVAGLPLVMPPLDEQRRISARVKSQLDHYRAVSERANAVIATLRERRQALISAAVTGQIDVGGAS